MHLTLGRLFIHYSSSSLEVSDSKNLYLGHSHDQHHRLDTIMVFVLIPDDIITEHDYDLAFLWISIGSKMMFIGVLTAVKLLKDYAYGTKYKHCEAHHPIFVASCVRFVYSGDFRIYS